MKILLLRFSSIGDIVLTTPVIRCLKQQLDCELHYLTKQSYASILNPNPCLDHVWTIQKKVSEVKAELQAVKFDYIIDLHNNIRTQQVKWALNAKAFTFNKINWQKWLMVNLKINRLPKVHIVDRYLQPATNLGIENDGKGLDYFIPKEQEINIAERFQIQGNYIAFAIGAAHATKRLPSQKIIEICQQTQLPILLLGGPAETKEGKFIARSSGDHVLNTCGQLNLHQSASVVRQAYKVITHDTGMMHIAAAFQKEILSIWGNTIPEFGMTPYYGNLKGQNTTFEVNNLSCRPCSKIGHATCPKGHFDCMQLQDVKKIVDSISV
ncbi:MAG: glycosyltransferase family 9 protein [Bacteroidota bacterium]